jgi:hypothetical protein
MDGAMRKLLLAVAIRYSRRIDGSTEGAEWRDLFSTE